MLPRRIQRVIRLVSRSSGSCRNQYSVPCRDFSALPQSDGEWVSAVASSPTTAKEAESDEYRGVNPSNDFSERKGDHCRKISVTRKLGKDLLNDPYLNKGTAFPGHERERLHIRGLLPAAEMSLTSQYRGVMAKIRAEPNPFKKWLYLTGLQDRNETLFYKCLCSHVAELAPIVYTPTVALACLNYSSIFRRPRGMFFSARDRHQMASMVYNWPVNEVEVVVVTDGSRVLGLGDLGLHGMGVVMGKVDLYVAGGGFYPARTLPCVIDVGTNNPQLLGSEEYLGVQRKRIEGKGYLDLVDEFMDAVKLRWPKAVIQFEDFETKHAEMLLKRYRNHFRVFNDDIQGTAATALAAVYGALGVRGKGPEAIPREKFVVCGAGSAGLGVANALVRAMVKHGASEAAARQQFYVFDHHGLITAARPPGSLAPSVATFARPKGERLSASSLLEVIEEVKPTALIGLTGAGKMWGADVLAAMGRSCDRPMIFPMSNPTDRAECTALEAAEATQNRAIFASGSPFEDVLDAAGNRLMKANQSNNFYIFPGVGLGAAAGQILPISDEQLLAAAEALAACTPPEALKEGIIFPPLQNIRQISSKVAMAVIKQSMREGQANTPALKKLMPLLHTDEAQLDLSLQMIISDPNQTFIPDYSSLVYRGLGRAETHMNR
uniref:Malic enzyme n=1 Tax=Pyramimonas obovata TaxID=1411642 RepID=A0A7S0RGB6_9CHLO